MKTKKVKLSLKKEIIEVLNQNEMSSLYGGDPIVRPDISVREKTCKNCESGRCVALSDYGICVAPIDPDPLPLDPVTLNECIVITSDCRIVASVEICKEITNDTCFAMLE